MIYLIPETKEDSRPTTWKNKMKFDNLLCVFFSCDYPYCQNVSALRSKTPVTFFFDQNISHSQTPPFKSHEIPVRFRPIIENQQQLQKTCKIIEYIQEDTSKVKAFTTFIILTFFLPLNKHLKIFFKIILYTQLGQHFHHFQLNNPHFVVTIHINECTL